MRKDQRKDGHHGNAENNLQGILFDLLCHCGDLGHSLGEGFHDHLVEDVDELVYLKFFDAV